MEGLAYIFQEKASARQANQSSFITVGFSYVYILQSDLGDHFYVGLTDDLQDRLTKHNNGEISHTVKHKPWRIKTAVAFTNRDRAAAFERYLKSGSGRAFAKKHL